MMRCWRTILGEAKHQLNGDPLLEVAVLGVEVLLDIRMLLAQDRMGEHDHEIHRKQMKQFEMIRDK